MGEHRRFLDRRFCLLGRLILYFCHLEHDFYMQGRILLRWALIAAPFILWYYTSWGKQEFTAGMTFDEFLKTVWMVAQERLTEL